MRLQKILSVYIYLSNTEIIFSANKLLDEIKKKYQQCNSATITEDVLIAIEGFLSLHYSILKVF